MDAGEIDYVGLLKEYAQKNSWFWDMHPVQTPGPEPINTFTVRVVKNGNLFHEGVGKTEEEAMQNAAKNTLSYLQNDDNKMETDSDSSASSSAETHYLQSSSLPQTGSSMSVSAGYASSTSEQSNINEHELTQNDETVSNYSTIPRFSVDFDSITEIGGGGFGRVFKARRKLEDKYFAVKVVRFTEEARREVFALSYLDHSNIVRYYSSWTEETEYKVESSDSQSSSLSSPDSPTAGVKFLYIQMELCEKETLLEWIEKRNNCPKEYPERRQEAADIIKQVLEAVKYIHLENHIHRDLKPANIMFGSEGRVKVGDFGLVTKEKDKDKGDLLERTKGIGTLTYMSPEQKKSAYDRKVDIFPVGLIYLELLWRIETQHEKKRIFDNVRSGNFPEQFCQRFHLEHKVIERMLCENPEGRPEASDILSELDQQ